MESLETEEITINTKQKNKCGHIMF